MRSFTPRSRGLEDRAALHAQAPLLLPFFGLDLGPPGGRALATPERDVGQLERALLLDDAAPGAGLGGLGVTLDHVHPLDHHPVLLGEQAQHAAALALLLAGDDDDGVVATQMHQRASGASEMLFMNRLARSSRATGPKIRVPMGSLSLSTSTAELASKRMYEPSTRETSLRARTMTA